MQRPNKKAAKNETNDVRAGRGAKCQGDETTPCVQAIILKTSLCSDGLGRVSGEGVVKRKEGQWGRGTVLVLEIMTW